MEVGEGGDKWAKLANCKGKSLCKVAKLSGILFTELSGYKEYHTLTSYVHLSNRILSHWGFQTTLQTLLFFDV